jgi:hypothetical protein
MRRDNIRSNGDGRAGNSAEEAKERKKIRRVERRAIE